ncbi:MAG: hypothetical protein K9L66_01905 [Spirochaetaceae bacterium]|nr:hypothetical protein [Spirochaetaceae bacterium]MCF7948035.1 hypothetical protein [Spirochaetia bacterium]MCF7950407.1 hypothetical protein [Spirochaetaceae bacterium]
MQLSAQTETSSAEDLIKETIYLDITTSSYYELQEWLQKLGLQQNGSRRDLENRLLNYYRNLFNEVPLTGFDESSSDSSKPSGRNIQIESAQEMKYLPQGEEQALIELDGGVSLFMRDSEGNTTHSVTAKALLFNQQKSSITAQGGVLYTMEQDGSDQEFKGEQISFNIENYSGVFIRGMSSRVSEIEENQISFYFKGGTIYRIKRDIVHLEKGIISSSRIGSPYYHLSAGNVWILGLNEWALQNATLYVGHIPVLYIPFYYRPGAAFVLHPSIGVKTVEGYYIQTTTYFLGRQPEELGKQSSLSFMQALDEEQQGYNQELRGFFLHSTREKVEPDWAESSGSFGKLQVDYYTRLGLLTALNFKLRKLGWIEKLDLLAGLGITNYIYPLSDYPGAYTSFTFDPTTDQYSSTPQNPYFLGNQLPFRFSFDLQLEYKRDNFRTSLNAPLYTDLQLHDQLRSRDETLGWTKLLTGEEIQETSDTSEFTNPKFYQHTTFRWSLAEKSRYIDSFNFSKIDSRLTLSQNKLDADENSLNQIGYYYPQTFTPLDFGLNIRGTLMSEKAKSTEEEKVIDPAENKDPGLKAEIRPPWQIPDEKKSRDKDSSKYKLPSQSGSIPLPRKSVLPMFAHNMQYTLNPGLSYHTQYDTTVEQPEEVNFSPLYSYVFADGTANLAYGVDLFRNSLQFDQTTKFRGRYRDHFAEEEGYDLESLLAQDKSLSYFSVYSISDVKYFFWLQQPGFSKSYTKYSIETELYRYTYNSTIGSFEPTLPEWNRESIQNHTSEVRFVYDGLFGQQALYTIYRMPPVLQRITSGVSFEYKILETSAEGEYTELDDKTWEFGPLALNGRLAFNKANTLSQKFTLLHPTAGGDTSISTLDLNFFSNSLGVYEQFEWNLSKNRPEKSLSKVKFWWLTGAFEMRHTAGYTFSSPDGWKTDEKESFQAYQLSAQLKVPVKPDPFWKGRVALSSSLSSALQLNLLRYTDSILQFSWDTKFGIAEFLDLKFSITSSNSSIYRYFPSFADELGVSSLNVVEDLLKSFNFFNRDDRLESNFNLHDVSFSLVHYMHDWQLNMEYKGNPELNEANRYTWRSEFSIFVQWKPIPEIKKQIDSTEDGFQ